MAKQTLGEWIKEAMNEGDKALGGQQENPLSAIALVHLVGGGGIGGMEKEVYNVKLGGSAGKAWKPNELGDVLRTKAQNYVQDAPGVQYFKLKAFYGSDEPKMDFPFLVNVHVDNAGGSLFTEGPDERGQKQQGMRHMEMAMSQVFAQQQHLNSHYQRALELLSRDAHDAKVENREMVTIMKEMIMEKALNNHESRMKEIEAEKSAQTRSQLLKMVPPLVNTVTGRNVFPLESSDTALVELIAESLNEETLGKLAGAGAIPPELMGPLMARMQAHLQKKREETEAKRKLLPAPGNPEDDAAGG